MPSAVPVTVKLGFSVSVAVTVPAVFAYLPEIEGTRNALHVPPVPLPPVIVPLAVVPPAFMVPISVIGGFVTVPPAPAHPMMTYKFVPVSEPFKASEYPLLHIQLVHPDVVTMGAVADSVQARFALPDESALFCCSTAKFPQSTGFGLSGPNVLSRLNSHCP